MNQKSQAHLTDLSQATRDRIAHIDFTLLFKGNAVRADLVDRFSIAAAQATKDFTLYRELAPGNIEYDQKLKLHKRGKAFEPLFDYDVVRTLATISQGYGDGFTEKVKPPLACEAPYHLNKPNLSILAKVSEAIHKGKALRITYVSLSSGETKREIVPHTLLDNGLRWHVRGFDRKHGEFRDFVLTRIKAAVVLEDSTLSEAELETQEEMRRDIKQQVAQLSEQIFRSKLDKGDISLRLLASDNEKLNWELAQILEVNVSEHDQVLRRKDGAELEKKPVRKGLSKWVEQLRARHSLLFG